MPTFRGIRITRTRVPDKGYFSPPKGTPLSAESAKIMDEKRMDEKRMPDGGKEQPPNLDEYPRGNTYEKRMGVKRNQTLTNDEYPRGNK